MRKTLVTIDGHIGSGGFDVGRKIARMLGWRLFDRVRLQAIENGQTLDLADPRSEAEFSDRLWSWIERAASYFAVGAAGDDPLLQGGADLSPAPDLGQKRPLLHQLPQQATTTSDR